jgi:carboxymethylenebutenolidase
MGDFDSAGLTAGLIQINLNGQALPVYRAQPQGKANLPVVLVISEIAGAREQLAEVARRFARQGYLALAPDLFTRSNPTDAQVFADLDAVVAWAKANGGNGDKISLSGFRWGGRITWLYAAHNPDIKTGVAWYGGLAGAASATFPRHPGHVAGAVSRFKQAELV